MYLILLFAECKQKQVLLKLIKITSESLLTCCIWALIQNYALIFNNLLSVK